MTENILLFSSLLAGGVLACGMLGCLVPMVGKLKWTKSSLMGLPSSTRIILLLLAVGLTFVGATKTNRTNGVSSSLGASSQVSRVRSTNALEQTSGVVTDTARFLDIDIATNGTVSLVAHLPSEAAAVAQDVVVVATTNLCTPTWFALTNTAFAAGETNLLVALARSFLLGHSISNLGIFVFCDGGDSDGDGLADWYERYNLKTNPNNADTDFDGIPDGVDDQPLVADRPVSCDGGHLASWTLWNATNSVPSSGSVGEVVYTHCVSIKRVSAWQQYFLSGAADHAEGWRLSGATIEWTDSAGGSGSTSVAPTNDSLRIAFSSSADYATFSVRVTDPTILTLPSELHLLGYAPVVTIGGIVVTNEVGSVSCHVFTNGVESAVPISIDRSHRPCSSVLADEETNVVALVGTYFREQGELDIDDSEILYTPVRNSLSGGYLVLPFLGIYPVPGAAPPHEKLEWSEILLFKPMLSCPATDSCSGAPTLSWNAETNVYEVVDPYPLDTSCLRKNWWRSSDGAWDGDHDPELDVGVDTNEFADIAYTVGHHSSCCTGTVTVCGQEVWSCAVTHQHVPCGRDFTDPLSDDCGCCSGGCADGDCSALERPEADTKLRFRIPFGQPRRDQVSGFLYFTTEGPTTITPALFHTKMRGDATFVESDEGTTHVYTCADARGRSIHSESIANGVRLTVRTQATDAIEHTWEITNVNSSSACVRFHQISRLGNTLLDWTFTYDADTDTWTKTDAVSGLRETVTTTGSLDSSIVEKTTRMVGNMPLTRSIVTSTRIGTGATAVLRETRKVEQGWNQEYAVWLPVSEQTAVYWNDATTKRHGKLRLLSGAGGDWEYHDFDAEGREILRIGPRNGAPVPNDFPSLDAAGTLQNAASLGNAFVTVYDYTPVAGDAQVDGDDNLPRVESRYAVSGGEATLIGRTWRRYTHPAHDGFVAVKCETWRVGSQNAVFGDMGNAYSYVVSLDEDAEDVPLVLRGEEVESLDEDGVRTVCGCTNIAGRVSLTTSKSKGTAPFPTYTVRERDDTYDNLLRTATYVTAEAAHTNAAVLIDEAVSLYDEQNRLRSTAYLDGTSLTNAYSCCRLLWSRDREGRTVLRSAVTGEDSLYYADEDVWLADISTNGHYRVTQHFFDVLGRETNTVVYAGATPGEASVASTSDGKVLSRVTTTYPCGGSDYSIRTDERGKVTVRLSDGLGICAETDETVSTNGVEIMTTESRSFAGGGSSTRRDWGMNCFTEERRFDEYAADGRRTAYIVTESSDCGVVTNSATVYDLLGRAVSTTTPLAETVNAYDGNTSRVLTMADTKSSVTTTCLYDACGEQIGTTVNGVTNTRVTAYEPISNEVWKVVADSVVGASTNAWTITRTRLTGLNAACRSEITVEGSQVGTMHMRFSDDPDTAIRTESSDSTLTGEKAVESKHGIELVTHEPLGVTTNSYDDLGRCVRTAKGDVAREYGYDSVGALIAARTLTGTNALAETCSYNMLGQKVETVDALGQSTFTAYDAVGNVVAVSGATYPVRYEYDTAGRRTALLTTRDGVLWDRTSWTYDAATGLCLRKTNADGTFETYSYTADGLLAATTHPSGQVLTNIYDANGKLVRTYSNDGMLDRSYARDEYGRIVSVSNGVARTQSVLHDSGIATNETWMVGTNTSVIMRTVDSVGRLNGLSISDTGYVQHFSYTSDNLIEAISNTDAVVTYTYAADRSETGYVLSLANGMTFRRSVTRDAHRPELVTSVTNTFGSTERGLAYTYDDLSRPISRNGDSFGYNGRGEVAEAVINGNVESHTYDLIGNSIFAAFQSVTNTYAANALNQYMSISGDGTCSPTYNANGDLLTCGALTFTYDADSRLLTVSSNGVLLVTNAYDFQGRRVRKTTPDAETTFLYDDWNLIRETVAHTTGGTDTFEYFWGRDLSGTLQGAGCVGGLLYVKRNGIIYIPFADANGNITAYADSTGAIVAEYVYDAFGRIIAHSGSLANVFRHRFSSKYLDSETGFYYYGYRFYNSVMTRWISRDPLEEDGGINLYSICGNNVISKSDYLGGISLKEIVLVNLGYDKSWPLLGPYGLPVPSLGARLQIQAYISGNIGQCCYKGELRTCYKGTIGVEAFLTWGVGASRHIKGRDRNKPDPYRPGYKNKDNSRHPPDSGYRSRSWHVEGGRVPKCPKLGFDFNGSGAIFLRGSAGVGIGVQFSIQKEISANVDLTEGWTAEVSGAWNVYGASVDFGGGGYGTWTYVQ